MSSSNHVKDSIVQLCRILKYGNVCDSVTPEHFRQAKNNKPDAIHPMTNLLLSIFSFLLPEHNPQSSELPDLMNQYGYCSFHENSLQNSREILLWISWLLHCTKAIELLREGALAELKPMSVLLLEKNKDIPELTHETHESFNALSAVEQLNYIAWLSGKVDLGIDRLEAIRANNAKLKTVITEKIHKSSMQASSEHRTLPASLDELVLIKNPSIVKVCEKQLEQKVQVLQAYIKWKELEDNFWDWMGSALTGPTLTDEDEDASSRQEKLLSRVEDCPALSNDLSLLSLKIDELKTLLLNKQKAWLCIVKENPGLLTKVRVEQKLEAERDTSGFFDPVFNTNDERQVLPKQCMGIGDDTMPLSVEMRLLRRQVQTHREELAKLQCLWRDEITLLAGTDLPEEICLIPPGGS